MLLQRRRHCLKGHPYDMLSLYQVFSLLFMLPPVLLSNGLIAFSLLSLPPPTNLAFLESISTT